MRPVLALSLAVLLPACEDAMERPAASPGAGPTIEVVEGASEAAPSGGPGDARAATGLLARTDPDRILVTPDKRLDRPTELLGVFDFHTAATSEDKGFDELRRKAAEMGADAVIGAEFEHGDGDEPSHLSGMAVRYR